MGTKSVDPKAHRLAILSDSEDEDNEPVGPLEGDEPPQTPGASAAPGIHTAQDKPTSGSLVTTAPAALSDGEETVPTLDPVKRREIKRAEQKRYNFRTREKGESRHKLRGNLWV